MSIDIIGPTPESRAQLKADFAMSSTDWQQRSDAARDRGDYEKARVFAIVARVAGEVATGGTP